MINNQYNSKMEKCNKCNNKGWIPYYQILNENKSNQGYFKNYYECNKCQATGYITKSIIGKMGCPGCTSFILGLPPKTY
jgi:DnaJ-class molecular chaperone